MPSFSFRHFTLLIAAATLSLTSVARATHYRVYLIGGQSNASGRADAAELSTAPLNATGFAEPQTDVYFYWRKTLGNVINGNLVQNTWVDLQPDTGHGRNNPSGFAVEFGPELAFGRAMADNDPSVNIAIIKYSHGGSNLHTQWADNGIYYNVFVSAVSDALDALTAAGDTYEVGGMLWLQGEADTGSQPDAYEANLTDLISRVRRDVFDGAVPGGIELPFVLTTLSDSQYSNITTAGSGPFKVRQAQEAVGAEVSQAAIVDTDGFSTYPGTVHFNATGQIQIGEACASQMLALEANDIDRDGLLLSEETTLGTDPDLADSDSDGQDDGFEVAAGTGPLDGSSFFRLVGLELDDGTITLEWPSIQGGTYELETSTDLETWSVLASGLAASTTSATTSFSTTLGGAPTSTSVAVASYDAESGLDGNFDTTAFDSGDTFAASTAGRLQQGGSLTGGGANLFVFNRESDRVFFDNASESGWPGFNFGGVNTASQAAAATAGDFFSFTIQADEPVSYEELSFYSDQFSTGAQIDVSYSIGAASEVFVVQGLVPTSGNAPVTLEEVDFDDFTTAEDVTWTFYIYTSGGNNFGVRFDDIKVSTTPAEAGGASARQFFRVTLQP